MASRLAGGGGPSELWQTCRGLESAYRHDDWHGLQAPGASNKGSRKARNGFVFAEALRSSANGVKPSPQTAQVVLHDVSAGEEFDATIPQRDVR